MRTREAVRLGASGKLQNADCLLGNILKLGTLWGFFSFLFYFVLILRVFLPKPTSKQGYYKALVKETLKVFLLILSLANLSILSKSI